MIVYAIVVLSFLALTVISSFIPGEETDKERILNIFRALFLFLLILPLIADILGWWK